VSDPPTSTIRERLDRPVTPELYDRIRRLWIKHSVAEDRRDVAGLLATLAEDCTYEVVPTGQRWEGHTGARAFLETFLGAFPDVRFELFWLRGLRTCVAAVVTVR
jgi:hypothetical protein